MFEWENAFTNFLIVFGTANFANYHKNVVQVVIQVYNLSINSRGGKRGGSREETSQKVFKFGRKFLGK